jgi:hypothetical protein
VTISGANLAGTTRVWFRGHRATIVSVARNAVKVVVPAGAVTGPISVTTAAGVARSSAFFTVT